MKTLIKQIPDHLMVAALFILLFLFANAATAQSRMVIQGTVITAPGQDMPVQAELVASSGEHMDVVIRSSGKFRVNAPADDTYVLRFFQAGSVTKEVVVDARAASAPGSYKLRKVRFDVALHSVDPREAARYVAPVGRIEVRAGGGRPQVYYHYELVPVSNLVAEAR